MMTFRYSICDPLTPEPIEMGDIEKEKILDVFARFPWSELLDKMKRAKESDIHFSPSLEFENKHTRHGLSVSIIEGANGNEFYIFYKRPKPVKKLFGLIRYVDANYTSDHIGQTLQDAEDELNALITGDTTTLEKTMGLESCIHLSADN